MIDRESVVSKLKDYLSSKLPLGQLVDWAENISMEEDFEEKHYEAIRDAISRLGVADVKYFGLTWEECDRILSSLGYKVKIEIFDAVA